MAGIDESDVGLSHMSLQGAPNVARSELSPEPICGHRAKKLVEARVRLVEPLRTVFVKIPAQAPPRGCGALDAFSDHTFDPVDHTSVGGIRAELSNARFSRGRTSANLRQPLRLRSRGETLSQLPDSAAHVVHQHSRRLARGALRARDEVGVPVLHLPRPAEVAGISEMLRLVRRFGGASRGHLRDGPDLRGDWAVQVGASPRWSRLVRRRGAPSLPS